MKPPHPTRSAATAVAPLVAFALVMLAAPGTRKAAAQVTEPNGVSVPTTSSLQMYLDSQGETINAVSGAHAEPGVFSPLCDFQATLVLNNSGAQAGMSWYNVPSGPTAAPVAFYPLVPQGTPIGQTVTAADIRNSANYAQGLVGFVLTKDLPRGRG